MILKKISVNADDPRKLLPESSDYVCPQMLTHPTPNWPDASPHESKKGLVQVEGQHISERHIVEKSPVTPQHQHLKTAHNNTEQNGPENIPGQPNACQNEAVLSRGHITHKADQA